ncbi:hypothetical protein ES705_09132 [subsurface metagenome]
MKLVIRYFGALTDTTSREEEIIQMKEQSTLDDFKSNLERRFPDLADHSIIFFANGKKIESGEELKPKMEIDCMPPFSGG